MRGAGLRAWDLGLSQQFFVGAGGSIMFLPTPQARSPRPCLALDHLR